MIRAMSPILLRYSMPPIPKY